MQQRLVLPNLFERRDAHAIRPRDRQSQAGVQQVRLIVHQHGGQPRPRPGRRLGVVPGQHDGVQLVLAGQQDEHASPLPGVAGAVQHRLPRIDRIAGARHGLFQGRGRRGLARPRGRAGGGPRIVAERLQLDIPHGPVEQPQGDPQLVGMLLAPGLFQLGQPVLEAQRRGLPSDPLAHVPHPNRLADEPHVIQRELLAVQFLQRRNLPQCGGQLVQQRGGWPGRAVVRLLDPAVQVIRGLQQAFLRIELVESPEDVQPQPQMVLRGLGNAPCGAA